MAGIDKSIGNAAARVLLLCLLLPLIAGCRTKEGDTPELAPRLNPHPKQMVRIFGRIPASLEVELIATYSIGDVCEPKSPLTMLRNIEEYTRVEKLNFKRDGDRFEARFMVDKYLPGACEWGFGGVGTWVVKDGNQQDVETFEPAVVEIDSGNKLAQCSNFELEYCSEAMNSDPSPAIVRCEIFMLDEMDKQPGLLCQGTEKRVYKRTHLVTPRTREVEVNFYDLALDEDPIVR